MSERPTTSAERKKRFKDRNPEAEARQKERERQRDGILRFHIRRYALLDIELPKTIDQTNEAFKRALRAYTSQCLEPTIREETA